MRVFKVRITQLNEQTDQATVDVASPDLETAIAYVTQQIDHEGLEPDWKDIWSETVATTTEAEEIDGGILPDLVVPPQWQPADPEAELDAGYYVD